MPETTWTPEQLAERAQCIAEVCTACARGEPLHLMRTSGALEGPSDLIELHHRDHSDDGGCILCPAAGIHLRVRAAAPDAPPGELVRCPPGRSEIYAFAALRDALRPFATCPGALMGQSAALQADLDRVPLLLRHPNGELYQLSVTSGDLRQARETMQDLARRGRGIPGLRP